MWSPAAARWNSIRRSPRWPNPPSAISSPPPPLFVVHLPRLCHLRQPNRIRLYVEEARQRPTSAPPRRQVAMATGPPSGRSRKLGLFFAESIRETVESIVIAHLAFLFRTFEAEAFVIPTGSMAPTPLGRHKDLECPQCGYFFLPAASQEVDSVTNKRTDKRSAPARCRYTSTSAGSGKGRPASTAATGFSSKFLPVPRPSGGSASSSFRRGGRTTSSGCGLPNETIRLPTASST